LTKGNSWNGPAILPSEISFASFSSTIYDHIPDELKTVHYSSIDDAIDIILNVGPNVTTYACIHIHIHIYMYNACIFTFQYFPLFLLTVYNFGVYYLKAF
jgi:hypothetical protein